MPVRDLALADLRRVYAGEVTDWREVGAGGSLPTVLVSRGAASGTRGVLRRRLLNSAFEPPASSRDCSPEDHPKARPVRCELDSTEQVIATVARTGRALPQRTAHHQHPGGRPQAQPRRTAPLAGRSGPRRVPVPGDRVRVRLRAAVGRLAGRRVPGLRDARARAGRGPRPRAPAVPDARGTADGRRRLRLGRPGFSCRPAPGTPRRSGTGPGSS
ncbi:substrate-binding domain-containing protein [Streptomyces sp. SID8014]|uniref:substrate-binding domain-containing protein n=1 Tax=Streptomyces sp. SID8014 TaxID=2706097 RepID=UPI0031BAA805